MIAALILGVLAAMPFDLTPFLNPNHAEIFKARCEEVLPYGGAGAGKSYSIADKLLLQAVYQPDKKIRVLVIRKTFPSLRATCMQILESRAETMRLPWVINKSEWTARCDNVRFDFQSLNGKEDFEKLKSRTDIDFVWCNELLELREADYEEILRRLRGGESSYQQIISDFNPTDRFSWVYDRFFTRNVGNALKLRYTVMDNHPAFLASDKGQSYVARLDRLAESNVNAYNVYRLGEWGSLEGVIFQDWDVRALPDDVSSMSIWYGGDFGFTVDPAALVKLYYRDGELWVEECIYETGLTNQAIAERMRSLDSVDASLASYWDSAEPKSIEELHREGVNAHPAVKGADSVRAGIDLLLGLNVHIVPGSENIVREARSYCWETDKNGMATQKPVDYNNHAMDAIRYAAYTRLRKHKGIQVIA